MVTDKNTTIDNLNGGKMNLTHTLKSFNSSWLHCLWAVDGQGLMVERHGREECLMAGRRKREEGARKKVCLSDEGPVTYLIQLDSISLLIPPPSNAIRLRIHQGIDLLIPFKSSVSCRFPESVQACNTRAYGEHSNPTPCY